MLSSMLLWNVDVVVDVVVDAVDVVVVVVSFACFGCCGCWCCLLLSFFDQTTVFLQCLLV